MHKFSLILLMLISVSTLLACEQSKSTNQQVSNEIKNNIPTEQLPTATEVFHLRTECAKLGDKILNNNIVGSALTQSQISYYNPKTNRCYVQLTISSVDLSLPAEKSYSNNVLYDGQTEEMLAFATNKNGIKNGMSFKVSHYGFDDVITYIGETMNDDDYFKK